LDKIAKSQKDRVLHRFSDCCLVRRGIPDYYLFYDRNAATIIRKYCSACLEIEKEREMERENANVYLNFVL
jgi:hypothetical protein